MERDYKKNQETYAKLKRLKEIEQVWDAMLYENQRLKAQVEALQKVADAYQYP
jgi:hypothetical protein